ncbi:MULTISPECIES: hypothetical protein [Mycobacterium]|uniref:hypothetical protein n=1 Tax=Mycobacterium TaxID=1763 RepID=UPI001EE17ABE|nr:MULTISPECIES: hypothetical protein [Mycobacterium]
MNTSETTAITGASRFQDTRVSTVDPFLAVVIKPVAAQQDCATARSRRVGNHLDAQRSRARNQFPNHIQPELISLYGYIQNGGSQPARRTPPAKLSALQV